QSAGSPVCFIRYAIIFIAHSEIQSEVRLHLKIVLKEPAEFALAPRTLLAESGKILRVRGARRIERFRDVIHRAAEIDKQTLRYRCVGAQAGNCSRVDSRYWNIARSQVRARHDIE